MKNIILLIAGLVSFNAFATEKGVYSCTQVDAQGGKPVSIYVKVTHNFKAREGAREESVFSVSGIMLNVRPEVVSVNFSEAIELENDEVQFSQAVNASQPAIDFTLKLNDSKSILSLHYDDIQVDNIWVNCRLSN